MKETALSDVKVRQKNNPPLFKRWVVKTTINGRLPLTLNYPLACRNYRRHITLQIGVVCHQSGQKS